MSKWQIQNKQSSRQIWTKAPNKSNQERNEKMINNYID